MLRRFLIWSGLAVVIGLAVGGLGVWGYHHFYARFQPVTIQTGQAEIQQLLDQSSWVSEGGGGRPLYVVGYRDSAPTMAFIRSEAPKLRAGGVDVRVLLFARPMREGAAQSSAFERATVAELWLNRDPQLLKSWLDAAPGQWTAPGVSASDGNLARSAVVIASRDFAARLMGLMKAAGVADGYPTVIWRDEEGFLRACACFDERSWAFVRDDFGAPDSVAVDAAPVVDPATVAPPAVVPNPAQPQGPAYPSLQPAPAPLPSAPVTTPGQVQPQATPSPVPTTASTRAPSTTGQAAPARPAPRTTPRASRPATPPPPVQEDTRFY